MPGALSTEASRIKFASSAVAFVKNLGLDGLDLDWEVRHMHVVKPQGQSLEQVVSGGQHAGRQPGSHTKGIALSTYNLPPLPTVL